MHLQRLLTTTILHNTYEGAGILRRTITYLKRLAPPRTTVASCLLTRVLPASARSEANPREEYIIVTLPLLESKRPRVSPRAFSPRHSRQDQARPDRDKRKLSKPSLHFGSCASAQSESITTTPSHLLRLVSSPVGDRTIEKSRQPTLRQHTSITAHRTTPIWHTYIRHTSVCCQVLPSSTYLLCSHLSPAPA